ncbi:hypothetical protein INT43_000592 [Umbelopsis isabellina]|uniref:Uncharacterized protein n=1 Tax=Mortierella isabellina TaxID=91625 RepID=A0A8H7Q1H0_MORIS|nr:hypothetical protein INT43_000592 [Umbelopsis isabellina]
MPYSLRPSHVLAGTMIIFGIFSVSVAAAKNATTLIVTVKVSAYYSFSAVAGALGGLIAYSTFSNLQNVYGMSSWQWLFLIEGIPTIFIGLLSFAMLPDYPSTASTKWLTTEEKVLCVERMNVNLEKKDVSFDYKQFKAGMKDYKNWMTALISLGLHVPLSSLLFFMPTFVKSMGFSALTSQLMTIPPYAFAFVAIIVASRTADITMQRGYHIFVLSITAAFGYILVFIPSLWAKYCGTILATMGVYGALPIVGQAFQF